MDGNYVVVVLVVNNLVLALDLVVGVDFGHVLVATNHVILSFPVFLLKLLNLLHLLDLFLRFRLLREICVPILDQTGEHVDERLLGVVKLLHSKQGAAAVKHLLLQDDDDVVPRDQAYKLALGVQEREGVVVGRR